MRHRMLTSFAGVVLSAACRGDAGVTPTENWAADLVTTQQVLFMTFTFRDAAVSGTGSLTSLTNFTTEALGVSGERRPDSLYVSFADASQIRFTFAGRYGGPGIQGILHGSEFDSVGVSFRRQ